MALFRTLSRLAPYTRLAPLRGLSTTPSLLIQTGYGDHQSERIENETPLPKGKAGGPKAKSGHATSGQKPATDKESSRNKGGVSVGNAGGKKRGGGSKVPEKEVKETKKIGEDPKKEEVGGAGPIGG
jgi:hypothetical protein